MRRARAGTRPRLRFTPQVAREPAAARTSTVTPSQPSTATPGNRALRALAHRYPVTGTMMRAGQPVIRRDWVKAKGIEGDERWDAVVGGRQWERLWTGDEYLYQFDRVDGEYEPTWGSWKPLSYWQEVGVLPPGTTPEEEGTVTGPSGETVEERDESEKPREALEESTAEHEPTSEGTVEQPLPEEVAPLSGEDWDVNRFMDTLNREGLDGICNGLTVAFLAGLIAPAGKGSRGLSDFNFIKVLRLKQFLDAISIRWKHAITDDPERDEVQQSEVVSAGLLKWAKADPGRLPKIMEAGPDPFLLEFWDYFDGTYLPQRQQETSGVGLSGGVTFDAPLTGHNVDTMMQHLVGLFGGHGGTPQTFEAIVAVHAYVASAGGTDASQRDPMYDPFDHEFAITFDEVRGEFQVFDQNSGLRSATVSSVEELAMFLATHLHTGYVVHPPPVGVPNGRPARAADYGVFAVHIL